MIYSYDRFSRSFPGLERSDMKLGLSRMRRVLKRLGNPEKSFKSIHVAGSNGKGSICAMLSSILTESGYKTGMYTSPHLVDVRERIMVDGKMIPGKDMERLGKAVIRIGIRLTYFEFLTVISFLYFRERKVDFAVVEVGLGGRLDATNVVNPIVSVITNISLEHMDVLGDTIEKIACEKSGIIKNDRPVVTSAEGSALSVIKKAASERSAKVFVAGDRIKRVSQNLNRQEIVYKNRKISLPLLGDFQIENANTAMAATEVLESIGIRIGTDKTKKGIENVRWPGRLEVVGRRPLMILDGAHNPAGIRSIKPFIKSLKFRRMILVTSIMKDKDYRGMLSEISPMADVTILTKADTDRAIDPVRLEKYAGKKCLVQRDARKAVRLAESLAEKDDLILVTGSIYLVGNVKGFL
jgi:dihydrofolate synthase/folylpolyglutamate synthase